MLGQIVREFPGKVRIVTKAFPLDFHEGALPAALAARCAADQGQFWPYHELLFEAQPDFAREQLIGYAGRLLLDRPAFTACLDDRRHLPAVARDVREGLDAGVQGTPTFFVNGLRLVGHQPVEAFREVVEDALAAGK